MLKNKIAYLKELKSCTTRYENVQMLNVQIDSIDRKKRSVAIKRSESIKVTYFYFFQRVIEDFAMQMIYSSLMNLLKNVFSIEKKFCRNNTSKQKA